LALAMFLCQFSAGHQNAVGSAGCLKIGLLGDSARAAFLLGGAQCCTAPYQPLLNWWKWGNSQGEPGGEGWAGCDGIWSPRILLVLSIWYSLPEASLLEDIRARPFRNHSMAAKADVRFLGAMAFGFAGSTPKG